jgi:hypothetical protein
MTSVLFVWLSTLAFGQTPDAAPAATGWLIENVESVRFPDGEGKGPAFLEGDEVTVVFKEGHLVRVMKGNTLGWVPADKLSAEDPAAVAEEEGEEVPAEGAP